MRAADLRPLGCERPLIQDAVGTVRRLVVRSRMAIDAQPHPLVLATALADLGGEELAGLLGVTKRILPRYKQAVDAFAALTDEARLSPKDFSAIAQLSASTAQATFEKVISAEPRLFALTKEFLPQVECMMDIIELEMGQSISSQNLDEVNQICSGLVEGVLKPRLSRFLNDALPNHVNSDGKYVLSVDEMLEFLMGDYQVFNKAQGAGLVSRAGGYNEGILKRALSNSGLVEGVQFQRTGQQGNGDMAIYCRATTPNEALWVEIKSYGARERLLRGLQDCIEPKVGVGFFNKAGEFNPRRTIQLMKTQALAIYMPRKTFEALHQDSIKMKNVHQSPFYRPLDEFVPNIAEFASKGVKSFNF